MKMAPKVERVLENFIVGEAPHWDVATQNLYFIDCPGKSINRYDPVTKSHHQAVTDGNRVAFFIPVEGKQNDYIIGIDNELVHIVWDGTSNKIEKWEKLVEVPDKQVQFNDGKADPAGRLWTGTMAVITPSGDVPPNKGAFYSLENGQLKQHIGEVHISNGLAWNSDLKKMYYIDSGRRTVDEFDYDQENGTISNRKPIFTLEKHNIPGIPDGMTIDSDGNLWVAVFLGSRVIKIDPRKPETLLDTVTLPALQVTSAAFGGPNLDELYVTTGRDTRMSKHLQPPVDGALYRVTNTGSKGLPSNKVKISV
ncbi:regucalcin-like isoform X2 [Agrilus planipennis]|uniref:Regucalcin n=1 Tax=Agrilus planipennis TaxID=224129 RepID=A0A1W4XBP4_AGRPL|nr:regucalcin-like isoform X2 [Agrilus planipennis]XP_018333444.1 regucalcin-like isoform X2 [Agrilus planipennis]